MFRSPLSINVIHTLLQFAYYLTRLTLNGDIHYNYMYSCRSPQNILTLLYVVVCINRSYSLILCAYHFWYIDGRRWYNWPEPNWTDHIVITSPTKLTGSRSPLRYIQLLEDELFITYVCGFYIITPGWLRRVDTMPVIFSVWPINDTIRVSV